MKQQTKEAPEIYHVGKRPARYLEAIEACARNIHLREQSIVLLKYYASQANGFKPAGKTVEEKTGIPKNKISEVRKRLVNHGLVDYQSNPGIICICWQNIKTLADLTEPLRLPQDKTKYKFFCAEDKSIIPEKEKKIQFGNLWFTEQEYFLAVEAIREAEFPSMPKGIFQKTGVHNYICQSTFRPEESELITENERSRRTDEIIGRRYHRP